MSGPHTRLARERVASGTQGNTTPNICPINIFMLKFNYNMFYDIISSLLVDYYANKNNNVKRHPWPNNQSWAFLEFLGLGGGGGLQKPLLHKSESIDAIVMKLGG